jgi:hypothetical protein
VQRATAVPSDVVVPVPPADVYGDTSATDTYSVADALEADADEATQPAEAMTVASSGGDDGPSALLITEIALGVLAAAALGLSLVMSRAARKAIEQ